MNLKSILKVCFVFCLLAMPAMAGTTGSSTFKMPGFSEAWSKIDSFLQEKIMLLIIIAVVILVIVAILAVTFGGSKAAIASTMGDVGGRSHGISSVIIAIAVVFLAALAVGAILWLAG